MPRAYSASGMSSKNATEMLFADTAAIERAARILKEGGLVAVPTETVYGLAARADDPKAVARIYAAKSRPEINPLIVHVRDLDQARELADFDVVDAEMLAKRCWPGPLTLVLPLKRGANLAPAVTAGLPTVAIRVPEHPVIRELLAKVPFPLAAPSANRSGYVSPTHPSHVRATLDRQVELVLDGGDACKEGLESTIVAIRSNRQWVELRPGPLDLNALHDELYEGMDKQGPITRKGRVGETLEAPGQMASHYSPGKPVRLNAMDARSDEFMIGFQQYGGDCMLSKSGDLVEAAAHLYDCLHAAAASMKPRIAVAPIPDEGVGRAINDRLRRAAA